MKELIQDKLKYWYVPLVLGILFIILGIWVLATPISTFLTLAVLFSFGFAISGLLEIFYSIANRKDVKHWGWYLAGGILSLVIGIHLMIRPDLSALIFSFYIGFWLLFRSIMNFGAAFELKDEGSKNWGWILVLSIFGLLFSFILLLNPLLLGLTVAIWIGFALVALGIIHIILSFTIRKVKKRAEDLFDRD